MMAGDIFSDATLSGTGFTSNSPVAPTATVIEPSCSNRRSKSSVVSTTAMVKINSRPGLPIGPSVSQCRHAGSPRCVQTGMPAAGEQTESRYRGRTCPAEISRVVRAIHIPSASGFEIPRPVFMKYFTGVQESTSNPTVSSDHAGRIHLRQRTLIQHQRRSPGNRRGHVDHGAAPADRRETGSASSASSLHHP